MEITEVRIKLMDDPHDRLQAFCSITFDGCFVIRDLKIIQGGKGSFVAMPSRKLMDRCPDCHSKNHLRAQFCNQCGTRLDENRALRSSDGRARLYADIAHPIKSECRETVQEEVLRSFEEELIKSKEPGYICRYDDFGENDFTDYHDEDEYTPPPSRTITKGETTHRLEPAASDRNGGPHGYGKFADQHRRSNETAGHASRRSDDHRSEDGFGAGII